MTALRLAAVRRIAWVALSIAVLHVVFGAIVRISGSGMGCGDHWPKCYGAWFPPFDQPTLVIEWTHRLLAALLVATVAAAVVLAWRWRGERGVGGRGGVLRSAALALGLVVATALFGAVTVKLRNAPLATVGHWVLAATLLATLAATVMRAHGLGAASALAQGASAKTVRGAQVAVALALLTVTLGGLTAKIFKANVACRGFPHCRLGITEAGGALHVHLTHRVLAVMLVLHLVGLAIAVAKRREGAVIVRAARVAMGLGLFQILLAAALVETRLPPQLRSLHQAAGVMIWLAVFVLTYLARIGAGRTELAATPQPAPSRRSPDGSPHGALTPRGAES